MSAKVGDALPLEAKFTEALWSDEKADYCGKPKPLTGADVFLGKRVVLVAVPGAFTPTCHLQHIQGFVEKRAEFDKYKVSTVACTSTNDAFVLGAWAKSVGAKSIQMLADGNGDFAQSLGLTLDLTSKGMGVRTQRYALVADEGVIKYIGVGGLEVSGADAVLEALAKL